MEDNKSLSMKRNISFSRRLSTIGGLNSDGKCNKILFILVILVLGIISGNFVFKLVFSAKKSEDSLKGFKRHIHEPPSSREGKSIKKDMSVQFRDYLPRKIFITTGTWFNQRESLKLFLQTYPESSKYNLYCFVEDESHKVFFTPFRNINIILSQIVADTNKTVTKLVKRFGGLDVNKQKLEIDFGAWIIETFHQDDYVVLRMESDKEVSITKHMGKVGALEWIDKLYTTSTDKETLLTYKQVLKPLNIPLYTWNDENVTYSDLNELNDPSGPKVTTAVISACGFYDQFLMVLYAPFSSNQTMYALEVLKSFASQRFLQTALFLTKDFIVQETAFTESLLHTINVGIFFEYRTTNSVGTYNRVRNELIEADHIFQEFASTSQNYIQYVMAKNFDDDVLSQLADERYVSVFTNTLQINDQIPKFLKKNVFRFDNITREHGQILAIDLTEENSELLMIYILKVYGPGKQGLLCIYICLGIINYATALQLCHTEINGMPWRNPCGGGGQGTIEAPPHDKQDKQWILHLVIVLQEIKSLIDALRTSYYLDSEIKNLIEGCNYLDTDFLHLEGFPESGDSRLTDHSSHINITSETLKDYSKLATIFVFFEQIVHDKDTHGGQKDWDYLCSIFRKLRNSLCTLKPQTPSAIPENFIPNRSVMKREYRIANNITLRMKRNYIIFKDTSKWLNIVIQKYAKLYFGH